MEKKPLDRRTFLTYLGTGATALAAATTGLGALTETANAQSDSLMRMKPRKKDLSFTRSHQLTKTILFYQKVINMKLLRHMVM